MNFVSEEGEYFTFLAERARPKVSNVSAPSLLTLQR